MRLVISLFLLTFLQLSQAQNLFDLAIRKIEPQKKSIYFTDGVYHLTQGEQASKLINIRHSYSARRGYERLVMDFGGSSVPKIYGYLSNKNKKIFLDFFNSSFSPTIPDLANVHMIKGIDFFTIDNNNFSCEINFKQRASFEIFYLENPGRLVIDIKK